MKKTIFKSPRNDHHSDPLAKEIAAKYEKDPGALIETMRIMQAERGGLTQETLIGIAEAFDISLQQVNSVSSFYTMLDSDQPEKTIRICDGPVCWLNGATELLPYFDKLIREGWVIERNSCLGLCDHAPAALIGEKQVGNISEKDFTILKKLILRISIVQLRQVYLSDYLMHWKKLENRLFRRLRSQNWLDEEEQDSQLD
ncbi:MAG: NAD(P)H-dependent oxidoreductase subunit E [Anaerolineales bacterium]